MQRSYNDESIRLHAELNKRLEKLEDLVGNLSSSISEEIEVLEGQSGLRLVPLVLKLRRRATRRP